jgi:signal transduction histidine kinase
MKTRRKNDLQIEGFTMKIKLRIKLTISYLLLSFFLISALYVVANNLLISKFEGYIKQNQEKKNNNIVNLVSNEFGQNAEAPSLLALMNIGDTALSQGVVLMVNDIEGKELFCMSTVDSQICENMIESMRTHMASVYPNFNGEYEQKTYDVMKDGAKVASVTLGFYGPFYYNEEDVQFLTVLNQLLIFVAIIFFIIAACLGFFMANRIARPINEVIDKTKQIEIGNYTDRITNVSKTTEINQLIHSVNTLAESLERQQISKKRMARDYAHELRTPLSTLQSNLEAMIDGIWEPTTERLESCREEILRLTRMISEINKLVEIESDSFILSKTKFSLADVVKTILINFQQDMLAKNISLQTDITQFEIFADKDKIIQVLINLLTNAIKYTDNDGEIKITVKQSKNNAQLIVKDTGIGISKEDLPNIFEHLYRADKSRNRSTGGSGIGLTVVKAIVDAHGGTIVTNSELGKGSEFIVTLPLE